MKISTSSPIIIKMNTYSPSKVLKLSTCHNFYIVVLDFHNKGIIGVQFKNNEMKVRICT